MTATSVTGAHHRPGLGGIPVIALPIMKGGSPSLRSWIVAVDVSSWGAVFAEKSKTG